MCSFIATNQTIDHLNEVNYFTQFRGPDNTTVFNKNGYTFVHNLLSLTGAFTTQPFVDEADDLVVIFNGEIYNYREIFPDETFDTDGRAIIPAYRAHGYDFAKQFDGEFAIAVFDFKKNVVVLTTDIFATKPLWLAYDGGRFGVSSYMSNLARMGFKKKHVQRLSANTTIVLSLDDYSELYRAQIHAFDVKNQDKTTYDDWMSAFSNAIRKRAVLTDKGVFMGLSSGYDSGVIACEMSRQDVPFKAYTILGIEDETVIRERHERIKHPVFLEMVQSEFKTASSYLKENCEEFQYQIYSNGKLIKNQYMTDDQGAVGLSHICSLARQEGYIIYMSGQGADEIFSDYGYGGHKHYTQSELGGLFPDDLERVFPWRNFFEGTQMSYIAKEDYVAGSYGIEGRYPFLDTQVVQEFLWLSAELKNRHYKAPLHVYLEENNFPFVPGVKKGFVPSKKSFQRIPNWLRLRLPIRI